MASSAAEDSPIVLVVDDVHAVDNASGAILHMVIRKLASMRLMLLLTTRIGDLRSSDVARSLASDASLGSQHVISLGPLESESAETLVRVLEDASGATIDEALTKRVLGAAGGNPLAIELLLKEWALDRDNSLLTRLDRLNTLPPPSLGMPRAIQTVFETQVSRLDRRQRAALDLAAILGRRCSDISLYEVAELTASEAAEALSSLCDGGFLREVHGELEFRNELLRAQSYFAVGNVARRLFHRRVADALISTPLSSGENRNIEIAWHLLRAGDTQRAHEHVVAGARRALDTGAPQEAQRILEALASVKSGLSYLEPSDRSLLARALLNQSNGKEALPILEALISSPELSVAERASAAGMAATAEHLTGDAGLRYSAAADRALRLAESTDDVDLIANALFESARAGAESGDDARIASVRRYIERLMSTPEPQVLAAIHYALGYCEYHSRNPRAAAAALRRAVELHKQPFNPGEMSKLLTGLAVCQVSLCDCVSATETLARALHLVERINDDSRASIVTANICLVEILRGEFEAAIELGERSVRYATTAGAQPALGQTYLNLSEAYSLSGDSQQAHRYQRLARAWVQEQRNWRTNVEFLCQAAHFALSEGEKAEALELIGVVDQLTLGRERAISPLVGVELLRIFRTAHVTGPRTALEQARELRALYRDVHPLLFLDATAGVAWLESTIEGLSATTIADLQHFEMFGMRGRRTQLERAGFVPGTATQPSLQAST
jgi:tetratricopeptide (TPR) repeat protein